jgi:hypothetical protein
MQLWRRLEWRKISRGIHDNGAEGNKYFFGTRRACAQCPWGSGRAGGVAVLIRECCDCE